MFYSKSTGGFYSKEINGDNMPSDVVEITDQEHADLLQAQSTGSTIESDHEGKPIAVAPPPPTAQALMQAEIDDVKIALQAAIDERAKTFGFSNGNAFMIYASFTNPFQQDALIFAKWEASIWFTADAYRNEVIAGTKPMVDGAAAVAMMPAYPSAS